MNCERESRAPNRLTPTCKSTIFGRLSTKKITDRETVAAQAFLGKSGNGVAMSRPRKHQPGRPKAQAGLELVWSYNNRFPHCAAAALDKAPKRPLFCSFRTIQLRLRYSYVPIDFGRYPPKCIASCFVTSPLALALRPFTPPRVEPPLRQG